MYGFVEDLKSRIVFENLPVIVTSCTKDCVRDYDSMYLSSNEEYCVKNCLLKSFEFQKHLN